mmetsp:Transcript_42684/g.90954  ORF Transcript_42684/g.90954 Transcript_42684/m.90954 type:complete len:346 (+) Transcript_42684:564-1601(+)
MPSVSAFSRISRAQVSMMSAVLSPCASWRTPRSGGAAPRAWSRRFSRSSRLSRPSSVSFASASAWRLGDGPWSTPWQTASGGTHRTASRSSVGGVRRLLRSSWNCRIRSVRGASRGRMPRLTCSDARTSRNGLQSAWGPWSQSETACSRPCRRCAWKRMRRPVASARVRTRAPPALPRSHGHARPSLQRARRSQASGRKSRKRRPRRETSSSADRSPAHGESNSSQGKIAGSNFPAWRSGIEPWMRKSVAVPRSSGRGTRRWRLATRGCRRPKHVARKPLRGPLHCVVNSPGQSAALENSARRFGNSASSSTLALSACVSCTRKKAKLHARWNSSSSRSPRARAV